MPVKMFGGPYDGQEIDNEDLPELCRLRLTLEDRTGKKHHFILMPPLGAVESAKVTGRIPKIDPEGPLPTYEAVVDEGPECFVYRTTEDMVRILGQSG